MLVMQQLSLQTNNTKHFVTLTDRSTWQIPPLHIHIKTSVARNFTCITFPIGAKTKEYYEISWPQLSNRSHIPMISGTFEFCKSTQCSMRANTYCFRRYLQSAYLQIESEHTVLLKKFQLLKHPPTTS